MGSKRRPGAPADLEELRPNLFVVHNPAAGPTLRGEGEREGDRFQLTGWRRDGLIARLRTKSFLVLTLADQIAALPALPPADPLGPTIARALALGERISFFGLAEGAPPGWLPAPLAESPGAVSLREGWVVRRRKGRGPGSYYRVARGTLRPLREDEAVRYGYALVALDGPVPVMPTPSEDGALLPDLLLPAEHRVLLGRIAERDTEGWRYATRDAPLVAALLARLGLDLQQG